MDVSPADTIFHCLSLRLANDPLLVPHHDHLLSYLTRVSNSMVESSSTMALSAKEFDILLILSEKPSQSDVTERLCSIFLRLLRQNVLSKKKKNKKTNNRMASRLSQQDLNCSILKVLQNLLINISDPTEKYLSFLSILCGKIIQRDQRIELMKLFQIFIDQCTHLNDT